MVVSLTTALIVAILAFNRCLCRRGGAVVMVFDPGCGGCIVIVDEVLEACVQYDVWARSRPAGRRNCPDPSATVSLEPELHWDVDRYKTKLVGLFV